MKPLEERARISQIGLDMALDKAIELLPDYASHDWESKPEKCKIDVDCCLRYLKLLRDNIRE